VEASCYGCETAGDLTRSVVLPGGWSVNHYGGSEGFFGWLALQPFAHRATLANLNPTELHALGPYLQHLERGISNYWAARKHPVARVYVMYFLEGQLEPDGSKHLHFHLVPRFNEMDQSMRDKLDVLDKKVRGIDAYLIAKLRPNNHTYRLPSAFDRGALTESAREELEIEIVKGVWAAGF
jgi:hypothetical protein